LQPIAQQDYRSLVAPADFIRVDYPEPHAARARRMLAAHPELRALSGTQPTTALWVVGLVAVQIALGIVLAQTHWLVWFGAAYLIGATIDHALWALIHDCSHNLVFRSRTASRWVAIVANFPIVVPGAISFCKYHLLHHRHMGDVDLDAGVPGRSESAIIGQSGVAKTIWLMGYIFVQGIVRPRRLRVRLLDGWTVVNIVVQFAALGLLVYVAGPAPLKYLVASTVFAIGLHPLGARWIQEHFALAAGQETYSYYGPLNRVSFNVGYHNEHHDLVTVPWSRLPEIRRIAPEFYDGLLSYASWTSLLVRFIADRNITLFNYIIRPGGPTPNARAPIGASSRGARL
jgi:sphingolipid 4-desaturase/C4-monooxygenase